MPALLSHTLSSSKLNSGPKSNGLRSAQNSAINLKENLQTCSICYDDLTGQQGYQLPGCTHIYHPICIGQWLTTPMKKMTENENPLTKTEVGCPNCRTEINLAADNNLITFNKILQRYEVLAKAAPVFMPFVENIILRTINAETYNHLTDQQLRLKLIPREAWDSLPGLRSYLTFLETSKKCLSQISYLTQELIANNNLSPEDFNENNIISILHLLDSMKTLYSLLDSAQPYSIQNFGEDNMVVDDEKHMPVSVLDLSKLKKAFTSMVQELDLPILFLLICADNKKSLQPVVNSYASNMRNT